MLPWKVRKCQILPVNQNLSSVYFSYAKFQLVSCDPSLAIIWQMTYTHKLPKLCSATLKENVEIFNNFPFWEETQSIICFCRLDYNQGERCLSECICGVPYNVILLASTVCENICFLFFLQKFTCISRQNGLAGKSRVHKTVTKRPRPVIVQPLSHKTTTIRPLTRRAQLACGSFDSLQDQTDYSNNVLTKNNWRNGHVNNQIAENYLQTKHQIDCDSATCITYSTDYYQRLSFECWFNNNLEQTPLNRSQQLPAPYKRLIDEIEQNYTTSLHSQ